MLDKQELSPICDALLRCETLFYTPPSLSLDPNLATYPGQLVIERALRSKTKSYRIVDTKRQQVKKTIILSDWSLNAVTETVKYRSSRLLSALLVAGFDVQFWDGGKLVKLNYAEVNNQLMLVKALPTKEFEKLKQQSPASDALLNLDYFEVRKLLQNPDIFGEAYDNIKSYVLDVADLKSFETIPKEILQWLKDKNFGLKLGEKFSVQLNEQSIKTFVLLLKLFAEKIKGVFVEEVKDSSLFGEFVNLENLEELKWKEYSPQPLSWEALSETKRKKFIFPKLKNLRLESSNIPATIVAELVDNSDALQELEINSRCLQNLKFKNLNTLQEATFSVTSPSSAVFEQLSNSTSLKSLQLKFCKINLEELTKLKKQANIFSELTKLKLIRVSSERGAIDFILQQCQKLEELVISNCEGLHTLKVTKETSASFANLKKLIINNYFDGMYGEISHETIANILNRANKLEELKLVNVRNLQNFSANLLSDDFQLPCLKSIDIQSCDTSTYEIKLGIPIGTYLKLLSHAPLMEVIKLYKISDLDAAFHSDSMKIIDELNLQHIETINVDKSNIAANIFIKILNKLNNVRHIKLNNCKYIDDLHPKDVSDNKVFNQLETIDVSESSIQGNTLAKIVSIAPNLKEVIADGCKNVGGSFNISNISKTNNLKLQEFSARDVNFSSDECIWLLERCQIIRFNSDLDPSLITENTVFNNLIEIKDAKLSSAAFLKIMAKSPNLRIINGEVNSMYVDDVKFTQFLTDATFKNLEEFRITNIRLSVCDYVELLKRSPKLTICNLTYIAGYETENDLFETVSLPQITQLEVGDNLFSSDYLLKFLKILPNLEKLSSTANYTLGEPEDIPNELHLPKLKSLALQKLNVSGKAIVKLLEAAPELEILDLSGHNVCDDLSVDLLRNISLKKLHTFKYKNSKLPFATIIKFNTMLEDNNESLISRSRITISEEFFKQYVNCRPPKLIIPNDVEFPTVKSLILDGVTLDGVFFNKLIEATPNVERIEITNLNLTDLELFFENLSSLKYLSIQKTRLKKNSIQHLISVAPNLRSIDIESQEMADWQISPAEQLILPKNLKFDDLQTIKIKNKPLPCNFVHQLISKSKNLKSLSLEGVLQEKETKMLRLRYPQFSSLNTLVISEANIDAELIRQIFSTAAELKTVHIGKIRAEGFFDKLIHSNKVLPQVTHLTLEGLRLPHGLLQKISFIFPNLQSFKIDHCSFYDQDNELAVVNKMPYLKQLTIAGHSIEVEDFICIVSNADNLEDIKLELHELDKISHKQREWLAKTGFNLSKVKTFCLKNIKIDHQLLLALLVGAPHITQLDVHGLKLSNLQKNIDYYSLQFPKQLTLFDYEESDLPAEMVLAIHAQNNKLTTLQLNNQHLCKPSAQVEFRGIDKLILNDSTVDYQLFRELLTHNSLKHLDVKSMSLTNVPDEQDNCKFSLPDLEFFDYESSNLTLWIIWAIHKAASGVNSKLKTFTLNKHHIFKNFDLDFPRVETIDLSHSKIDFAVFISLISSSNRLNSLKVNYLELTNIPEEFDYSSLKIKLPAKFEFSHSNLPLKLICSMYMLASTKFSAAVSDIIFSDYSDAKSQQQLSKSLIHTDMIRKIFITRSHFYAENFLTMLCGAKYLSFLDCQEASITEKLSPINLLQMIENQRCEKLRALSFSSMTMSAEVFLAMLMLAPKLEKIYFMNVNIPDLKPEDIPANLVLTSLVECSLINSGLSNEVVEKLRNCAPNLTSIETKERQSSLNYDFSRLKFNQPRNIFNANTVPNRLPNFGNKAGLNLAEHFAKILSSNWKPPIHNQSARDEDFTSTPDSSSLEAKNTSNSHNDFIESTVTHKSKSYTPMPDKVKVSSNDPRSGKDVKLNAKEFFVSEPYVHPRMYRLQSYILEIKDDSIIVTARKPRRLLNPSPKINILNTPIRSQFQKLVNQPRREGFFEDKLIISAEWATIPSLFAGEAIVDFYCDFPAEYEIQYSPDTKFYYIRAKNFSGSRVTEVSFTLNFDNAHRKTKRFDREAQTIIDRCSVFHEGDLIVSPTANDVQILEARYDQQIGSCENRSITSDYKLTKLFNSSEYAAKYKDFEISIIRNRLHTFIEIDDGKRCYQIDLDGYEATVELDKIEKIDLKTTNDPVKKILPQPVEKKLEVEEGSEIKQKSEVEQKSEVDEKQNIPTETPNPQPKKKIITEADLCPELITWKKSRNDMPKTSEELFKQIILPGQKSLLKVREPDDCLKIVAEFAEKIKKPYLFIDSADDLQWQAPGLKFNKNLGSNALGIKKCFSKLRYFLETYPDGVLFINWSNFSNTEIAALHSVIDEKRQLEGEDLPLSLPIIDFYCDNLGNAYKDADFTTRHDLVAPEWPYELSVDLFHHRKKELATPQEDVLCIDLFETEDWEGLLFGAINIYKNLFSMELSDFSAQLENKTISLTNLHLKNPPWHLREFQLFWQHALQQKSFALYGRTFTLDEKFQLSYSQGYQYRTHIIQNINKNELCDLYPLNSHTFPEFFPHYIYQDSSFERTTGILQASRDKTLTLVVTENLSKNQWSRLLAEASFNYITLNLSLAEGVKLPAELGKVAYQAYKPEILLLEDNFKALDQSGCAIIYSKDFGAEICTELLSKYPDAMYISLDSTHDFGDLFYQIHPSTSEDAILANFINSDPWRSLKNEKTVIIEGRLPLTLINALSPLLVSGRSELIIDGKTVPFKGKLLIVTDQEINFAANQFHCKTLPVQNSKNTEKEEIVTPVISAVKNKIADEVLDDPNDLSEEAYQRYKSQRFNNIITGFKESPIIAYTGPTGIGKTTYLEKEFEQDYLQRTGRRAKLYVGEGKMEEFAAHKDPDVDPFLFIDEANLSDQKLSVLKGLTSKKPHLLKNGHYYNLLNRNKPHQTQHRVILACNLKAYAGGVRQQEEFFAEHAAIVECHKPNHAYLYHEIIKPKLQKNHTQHIELAKVLLAVFDKINEIAETTNALVSPRHLHMMTVLLVAYLNKNKNADLKETHLAISACLAILGDSLSAVKHGRLLTFLQTQYNYEKNHFATAQARLIEEKISQLSKARKNNFTFTKSRFAILSMLDLFLSLRSQSNFHFGLLLEGDSAVGKSTLLRKYLELLNIEYFQFTFSNNYQTDCRLLLEAYYDRKVIIIDELNAGGQVYERLINTLIMGTEQEINDIAKEIMPNEYQQKIMEYELGSAQNKPRSIVVATQNSLSLAGRQALTPAMQARFVPLVVPDYQPEEITEILVTRGVTPEAAKTWVAAYLLNTAYASFHRLEPKPNLRDLLKAAGVAHLEDNYIHIDQTQQLAATKQRLEQNGLDLDCTAFNFSNANLVNLFYDKEKANNEELALINEITENAPTPEKSTIKLEQSVVLEIESLTYDKELLQDIEEKIDSLQDKIDADNFSTKNNRRQTKIDFLCELKNKYECYQLNNSNLKDLSQSAKYKSLFNFFGTNGMSRFKEQCQQSIKMTAQAKKIEQKSKSNYVIDKVLVNDLKTHAQKLHDEFNKDRHAFLANRRWQKYTALRKIIRLYENNQLTKQHIGLIEIEFSKMYNGVFSHKTRDLMDRVKTSIGINKDYTLKVYPGVHTGAIVIKVPK